jgi:hypothetical protein
MVTAGLGLAAIEGMRPLLFALLTITVGCANSDLQPADQGVCSNLDRDACLAKPNDCQLSFSFGAPVLPLYCLALEGDRPTPTTCPQDHDDCRATRGCSPVFLQKTGPTDAAVGDPQYDHCDLTTALLAIQ